MSICLKPHCVLSPDSMLCFFSPCASHYAKCKIQNANARVVTHTRKRDHITPAYPDHHWLQVRERVECKVLCLERVECKVLCLEREACKVLCLERVECKVLCLEREECRFYV